MHVFRLALAFVLMVPGAGWAADFIYVSLGDDTIRRYDVSLGTAAAVAASEQLFVNGQGLRNPKGLAFDSSGNLYAANYFNSTITRYDSSGTYIGGTPFVPAGQGLNGPTGLAFDSSGRLYAANIGSDTITRYDSSGNRIGTDFVNGQGLISPNGLAFDSSGRLYAANYAGSTITRYSSTGVYDGSPFVSEPGRQPIGLAFDSLGNLYAANNLNSTISKINSAGTVLFSWSTPAPPSFLAFAPTIVPEPSTYILGTIAALTMAILAQRKRRTVLA